LDLECEDEREASLANVPARHAAIHTNLGATLDFFFWNVNSEICQSEEAFSFVIAFGNTRPLLPATLHSDVSKEAVLQEHPSSANLAEA
jgi:hypothetical protein